MRNWIQGLTSPTFRSKVFLSSFICIGIPVLLSLSIYHYLTRDAVEEQAMQNATKELDLTEENISRVLDNMLNTTNFVQNDSALNTILKDKSKLPLSMWDDQSYHAYLGDRQVRRTMENITLLGEKSYVTILLSNGKYYTNYSTAQYNPNALYQKQWFQKLQSLNGFESNWSSVEETVLSYERVTSPYQISVGRTLRDSNQEIYGYVVVTLLENKIRKILENQKQSEEIMLINKNHEILSSKDRTRIGDKISYSGSIHFDKRSQIMQGENQKYVVATKELTFNDWQLVSIIPYKAATSNIHTIFSKVFLLLAISFAVFFVILAYLMNRITKPLRYLDKVVRKVQKGDLTVRAEVNSRDEIGEFSQSFNQMLDQINDKIDEINHTQKRKRKAELAMLQAQINPHFLFNVLNSIRMKVFQFGDRESADMIQSLSKLLRWTISHHEDFITFVDEVSLVKDYVNVMNMRQKHKVELVVDVTSEAYQQCVPRFLLQPLIENSIIHAFNQGPGVIIVRAKTYDDRLEINVIDNGQGMKQEQMERLNRALDSKAVSRQSNQSFLNIGIKNVYERLKLSYRKTSPIKIASEDGEGTTITIQIPLGGEQGVQGDVG
ncbi:histidine kinase [Gracilibacillus halophilus YIM-C55.5]|uniref:histidine kinase n=1 Tax=Gracilibacillus halophilus YIM-C55.5 TaxID=1308866 RepID=N4W820_9BACI|nr:sensor histidine kinase [Gracilibacillus halophilus]ENH96418.1 histidine kinase [Gracilibacillus halophilus YIM-C55.5]